jgi:glycosyltransferase involved in cell wall biosynthesis
MSAAAREFAERFDWDRCADEVAAIYRQLVVGAADADLRT